MKKLIITATALSFAFLSANALEEVAKIDVKDVCKVEKVGAAKALEVAKKYNPEAIKLGVEFKRLGIKNREYIKALEEAIKAKKKETIVKYDNNGKEATKTFETNFLAERACKFAVRALQQVNEAEKTWRLAVPGDGFKY